MTRLAIGWKKDTAGEGQSVNKSISEKCLW